MSKTFDAIIIGAGQAGPSLAGRLTAVGMSVALIERKLFGGTCVNTGCTPTKALVASAHAAHLARRAAEYGVTIQGAPVVDMVAVKARMDNIVSNSRRGLESWLEGMERCTVVRGQARFLSAREVEVGGERLTAERIFINVGGRPFVPALPGVDRVAYLTSSSILQLEAVPRHLVVVGGSYVGLEFAQIYRRFGSEVTVVEKGARLIGREDEDVSAAVREILEGEGIEVRTSAECIRFEPRGAEITVGVECEDGPTRRPGQPRAACGRAAAEQRRSRPRCSRRRNGCARLRQGRRPAADDRARHLGARRLQRPRRLHPYRL
jgi:pyruvate/2-oxoglutarate dehydrogenase complex dihydrolipoamide dehydrogenase (E3) component